VNSPVRVGAIRGENSQQRSDKYVVVLRLFRLTALVVLALNAVAQPAAKFKQVRPNRRAQIELKRRSIDHFHAFIQIADDPAEDLKEQLTARGIRVLSTLPDGLLLVSVPDGVAFETIGGVAESLDVPAKVSSELTALEDGAYVVVEFHSDTARDDADSILLAQNLEILDRPDMLPNQRLVRGSANGIRALENWDEVSYIFPASADLISGIPVTACPGALTESGPLGQYIATVGNGWDGPGLGSAALTYSYSQFTGKLSRETITAALQRALAEWAKYAQVTFTYAENAAAARSINFLFGSRAHGDPYPFDGPGKVLAHTFYPYPTNPEPIAGDMHLDADEPWQVGADVDLFSVVLHEVGHGLGLGHSDRSAAVMYPYYKRVAGLSTEDIAAVRTLYAAQVDGAATPAVPLSITANAMLSTTAPTADLTGTTTGGSGEVRVTWITGRGTSGSAAGVRNWTISAVPLVTGPNTITITATDSLNATASSSLTINRSAEVTASATAPKIVILSPAPGTAVTQSAVTISGTASYTSALQRIQWVNSRGGTGQASGTTAWFASVPLQEGTNSITFTVIAADGRQASQTIQIQFSRTRDSTGPSLTINSPATSSVMTTSSTVRFSGTASDNVGVVQVTWSSSTGGSGEAIGTNYWSTPDVPLLRGTNVIIIKASDDAGNMRSKAVTVTRR
jgi:hypothetical protein